ncbi:hypothetical protein MPSEU_000741400 [Mayamaea pseudoterrestris]|nr:hypothetical protein MPSEU_000741400 [Mayamaea pseudoterrestris]
MTPPNPFESLWRDVEDANVNSTPKKTPKKRLFAIFFQRQSKSKSPKPKTPVQLDFKPLPSHTSVSSASSGFPTALVEPSNRNVSGSRSIASGSIYTSFSTATMDTQRKEMTSDCLLRGARDVLGSLAQQSHQRDARMEQANQQRRASMGQPAPPPIVGSTIHVAPKMEAAVKTESPFKQQHRLQQQQKHRLQQQQKSQESNLGHCCSLTTPSSPPRMHRHYTPTGCTHQPSTPSAPLRTQEHTTTVYTTAPQSQQMYTPPPALQFNSGHGQYVPPPQATPTYLDQQQTHSSMALSQPTIEIARGVSVPLRGFTAETMNYIAQDAMTMHYCGSCGGRIYCIQDAEYILCPNCRTIERLHGVEMANHNGSTGNNGGVGLGITEQEWMERKTLFPQSFSYE